MHCTRDRDIRDPLAGSEVRNEPETGLFSTQLTHPYQISITVQPGDLMETPNKLWPAGNKQSETQGYMCNEHAKIAQKVDMK